MRLDRLSAYVPAVAPPCPVAPEAMVGRSDAFVDALASLRQVAPTTATVLILGETGTGKGVAAREVHRLSRRAQAPFVAVDCGSLPATLMESELFGRERGAFTDARSTEVGRFELADGGTIFLDEVGELPLETQVKLLRVIQFGEFERLGSPRTRRVDIRVIAATNRNLLEDVRTGRFRRDLYYRLNVFPVRMPALRERREDIPLLAEYLTRRLLEKYHRPASALPTQALDSLMAHDWPGNVRELENVLTRAAVLARGPVVTEDMVAVSMGQAPGQKARPDEIKTLRDAERDHVEAALYATGWNITHTANILDISPTTLRKKITDYDLTPKSSDG